MQFNENSYICTKLYKKHTMRQLTLLIILAILAFSACQNPVKKVSETSLKDSIQNDSIAKEEGTIRDTSWGDWNIHIQVKENNLLVKGCNWHPKDSSYFITMTYKGKKVFDRLEIDKNWLNKKQLNSVDSLYTYGAIFMITNTSVYMTFQVIFPDSDWGDYYYVIFNSDGTTEQYDWNPYMGEETGSCELENFYIFYSHELKKNPLDKASLQKIAKEYCSQRFCKKLEKEGSKILFPDSWPIIKNRVCYFESHSSDKDSTKVKQWYNTLYFHSKDKLLDSLKIELIETKNHGPKLNGVSKFNKI